MFGRGMFGRGMFGRGMFGRGMFRERILTNGVCLEWTEGSKNWHPDVAVLEGSEDGDSRVKRAQDRGRTSA
jgi:MOSC domain-containing protein YiiM